MELRITISALVSWALWVSGAVAVGCVSFGILPVRMAGSGILLVAAGATIYLRCMVGHLFREERMTRELREMMCKEITPMRRGR